MPQALLCDHCLKELGSRQVSTCWAGCPHADQCQHPLVDPHALDPYMHATSEWCCCPCIGNPAASRCAWGWHTLCTGSFNNILGTCCLQPPSPYMMLCNACTTASYVPGRLLCCLDATAASAQALQKPQINYVKHSFSFKAFNLLTRITGSNLYYATWRKLCQWS